MRDVAVPEPEGRVAGAFVNEVYGRIDEIVTGPRGLQWLEKLFRFQQRESLLASDVAAADELVGLGICTRAAGGVTFTEFGRKCADSAREYTLWQRRKKALHSEHKHAVVSLENFSGKDVLEIGSGCGCNLLRLATVARCAMGVEVEPVYIEFARMLARREGVPRPLLVRSSGESLPLRSQSFDWVMLWSVLQYTDVDALFAECSRLLRPGGYVLSTQILLPRFIRDKITEARDERSPRKLLSLVAVILNTLWYQLFRTRLRANIRGNATARPIHPTKRFLAASARRAGLQFRADLSAQPTHQFSLVLQKPLSVLPENR